MNFLTRILLICFVILFSASAQAQFVGVQQPGPSLLLFYFPSCEPCKEIVQHHAVPYSKTETGKRFPLLVVNPWRMPQWLKDAFKEGRIKKEQKFPILVKWDGEKELGRMVHVPK